MHLVQHLFIYLIYEKPKKNIFCEINSNLILSCILIDAGFMNVYGIFIQFFILVIFANSNIE